LTIDAASLVGVAIKIALSIPHQIADWLRSIKFTLERIEDLQLACRSQLEDSSTTKAPAARKVTTEESGSIKIAEGIPDQAAAGTMPVGANEAMEDRPLASRILLEYRSAPEISTV
jgi:hypothetical protein